VFAVTDVMALGVAAAIRAAGLEPGRDIGVAGFDDIDAVQDVSPAITTVAIPLAELGAQALRASLGTRKPGDSDLVAGEVVLRDSTPPRP
jgi:LacI family transcriptional regulator